jgi:4-carboxymuconolactone decarboxylase
MNPEIYEICKITSAIAGKKFLNVKKLLHTSKKNNLNPDKIYEAILQTYLFCGFPAAIEAMKHFNSIYPDYTTKLNSNKNILKVSKYKTFYKKGKSNCKLIYKNNFNKLMKNFNRISPDLSEWMILEGYGKVMSRPGLNIQERECINVSLLCSNFFPVQLYSHIKGALNVGVEKNVLNKIILNSKPFTLQKNIDYALKLLRTISEEIRIVNKM